MSPNTVYIAEDEQLAREALAEMFRALPNWSLLGAARNGEIALRECSSQPPDLLVTDIRMPLLDGLELASELRSASPATQVMFVTAYDQHAISAFRLAAIDYLLKPLADAEFRCSITRTEEALRRMRLTRQLDACMPLDRLVQQQRHTLQHLAVRSLGRVDIVPFAEIVLLQADGNYVNVVTAHRSWLHRETLKSLSERLDPARFLQIHRSAIVAIAQVRGIERGTAGVQLRLADGTLTPVSPRHLPDVQRVLGA